MQQILLVVQVLVAVAIIGIVMLQQGRGADAGASFGGGASGSLFGSRGPATFLAKITAVLAAVFFVNSIGLAYLASRSVEQRSVVERVVDAPDTVSTEEPAASATPDDLPRAPGQDEVPQAPTGEQGQQN